MSDWIEWTGGKRPVAANAKVAVRLRDGGENIVKAGDLEWRCAEHPEAAHLNSRHTKFDIVAYKKV